MKEQEEKEKKKKKEIAVTSFDSSALYFTNVKKK